MTNEIEYSAHFEEADRFLRRPYARIILPESDGTFRGEIMEFPGCIATGDSAPETLATLARLSQPEQAFDEVRGREGGKSESVQLGRSEILV